jgi:amino acid permease
MNCKYFLPLCALFLCIVVCIIVGASNIIIDVTTKKILESFLVFLSHRLKEKDTAISRLNDELTTRNEEIEKMKQSVEQQKTKNNVCDGSVFFSLFLHERFITIGSSLTELT